MTKAAKFISIVGPLLVVAAFGKIHAAIVAEPPYDYTGGGRLVWSLFYAGALALASYSVGLPEATAGLRRAAASALGASLLAAMAISLVQLALGDALLPRFVVGGAALANVPVQVLASSIANHGRRRREDADRLIIVDTSGAAMSVAAELGRSPERPAVVVALVSPSDVSVPAGPSKPLIGLVIEHRAGVVVIDRAGLDDESVVRQAAALHEAGVRVRSLLQFYEEWLGKLPASELERASLFFDIAEVHTDRYGRLKRMLDVAGALMGLVPLLIALPIVLLGNVLGNRGPLLYRQERVGRDGKLFEIIKFRTMSAVGDDGSADWTVIDDARVTPFGGLLRRSHLDELPQVVNILRGDLSLVGPRPEQPRYVRELSEKLPFYGMRHLVRPGLSGWAQVKYGYASNDEDAMEKLQYEFFYLRHQSLSLDLRIIGRTMRSVVGSEGAGR